MTEVAKKMKLFYFKAKQGNFGDDLNPWVWETLFPGVFCSKSERHFIGIGSILDDRCNQLRGHKIVFGTGARSMQSVPTLNRDWDIRFVRGPLSAKALELPNHKYISDGALAIGLLKLPEQDRRGVALMPHYRSMPKVDWSRIATKAGCKLVDPRLPVDTVLRELSSAERLVTEAMHGAIIADVMRIPWVRIVCHSAYHEGPTVSEFKWQDWMQSLRVESDAIQVGKILPQSSLLNTLKRVPRVKQMVASKVRQLHEFQITFNLKNVLKNGSFVNSNPIRLREAIERISDQVEILRNDLINKG